MEIDEDLVITDEDVVEEVNNTEEKETIEITKVSDEVDPENVQDDDEDEEEDRIITIDGTDPETKVEEEETKETPGWVKKVRKVNRKLEGENKRLKRQLEANAKAVETEKPIELGKEPTLADCKYDDLKYKQELRAYDERKRKVEEQSAQKAKTVEEQNKNWQTRQEKYVSLKQEHSFKDFGEAEETVAATLSQAQQSIIVSGADDSALLVYALGKNPKKLEELSKISDPVDFAFKVAKLESKLKVSSKKAPKPERQLSAGTSGGSVDNTLERLETEALKSGDRTKIVAYKRKLRKGK